jgi:poly(ADP-ribose) glycohydrolase ARH3
MVLACASALVSTETIDPDTLLREIAARYEPARGFGRGMKLAISAFESGTPWDRCAFSAWPEGSRGNGGAVRIAPIAVARWPDAAAFDRAVHLATRITHAHHEALEFARLQAVAIVVVLESPDVVASPAAFRAAIVERLESASPLVADRIELCFDLVAGGASTQEASRLLGTSTMAVESVCAALWSFASSHGTFEQAVRAAALLGGDVDSICCLVGALAGALHGAAAIDSQWVANLARERPSPTEILALADALHALVARAPS